MVSFINTARFPSYEKPDTVTVSDGGDFSFTFHREHYIKITMPDGSVIHTGYVWMTPQTAQAILDMLNTRNRPIRQADATKIAEAIQGGQWHFTGDTVKIAIDENGKWFLGDAQHRLTGVVIGGKPVLVLVVIGITAEASALIDQNRSRSVNDIVHMAHDLPKRKNSTVMASLANMRLIMEKPGVGSRAMPKPVVAAYMARNHQLFDELVSFAVKVSEASQWIPGPVGKTIHSMSPAPVAGLAMYMIEGHADPELVRDFLMRIATGTVAESDKTGVIAALRNRQRVSKIGLNRSCWGGGGSTNKKLLVEFYIYMTAFNRWVTGQVVERITPPVKNLPSTSKDLPAIDPAGMIQGEMTELTW